MTTASDASTGDAVARLLARARAASWRIVRGTTAAAFRYRVTGLAAEAAFFTLLSLPPLVLGLIGTIGHFRAALGAQTINEIRDWLIDKSETVLTDQAVTSVVQPLLDEVLRGGKVEIVSLSFVISLWAGSRALNVYVDTITIAYGLSGVRGIIRTRLRAFFLYLGGLGLGLVVIPVLVAGPALVLRWLPEGARVMYVLYWPVLSLVAVIVLSLLYHLSVPVRTAWSRAIPGSVMALAIWVLGSIILRVYLDGSTSAVSVYGSLGAAIAVLAWLYVTALAVLIGAAMNAEIDRLWPGEHTARARAQAEEARARADEACARAAESRAEIAEAGIETPESTVEAPPARVEAPDSAAEAPQPRVEVPESAEPRLGGS